MRAGLVVRTQLNYINPPESQRTYSTVWSGNQIGTGHATSTIDSPQGWSAQNNVAGEWMIIDADEQVEIIGLVVQARAEPYAHQIVTRVNV